ncbi:hypothetical protein ACLK2E_19220 [Escherichia coli]
MLSCTDIAFLTSMTKRAVGPEPVAEVIAPPRRRRGRSGGSARRRLLPGGDAGAAGEVPAVSLPKEKGSIPPRRAIRSARLPGRAPDRGQCCVRPNAGT